jgi:hypothetical protein
MTHIPALSVVVCSVTGADAILPCLAALREAGQEVVLEVLVADRCGEPLRASIAGRHPDAIVIPAPPGTSIPDLRMLALGRASAEAVAVIEDHVIVPPDWARRMVDAIAEGADVVGGTLYNGATSSIVDRVAFLCEYAPLIPPLPRGPAVALPGNNIVYRRTVLDRYRDVATGQWEDVLHEAMRRDGIRLERRPEIRVEHRLAVGFAAYLEQRYLYSRSYAGMRALRARPARRLLRAAASLALPALLLARIARHAWRARLTRDYVAGFPLLVAFVGAWAAGESVGWFAGPGDALARVR